MSLSFPTFAIRDPNPFLVISHSGNSTRHFRSHWIKGKSKLNCPKAAAEIYDLFVLSDQTKFTLFLSDFLSFSPSLLLSVVILPWPTVCASFHLPANIRSSKMTLWPPLHNVQPKESQTTERSHEGRRINTRGNQWVSSGSGV